jgi:hypothetical protein
MITLLALLLAAAPALAQPSRLYTNNDLRKPLTSASSSGLSPADAATILAPYQFQAVPTPEREWGPQVYVMGSSSTSGPFGEFAQFEPPRRLDGSSWLDPEPVYGLPPWFARGHGYQGDYGPRRGFDRRLTERADVRRDREARPTAPAPPRSLTSPPARAAGRILR